MDRGDAREGEDIDRCGMKTSRTSIAATRRYRGHGSRRRSRGEDIDHCGGIEDVDDARDC
jgi:hypothetical protein